MTSYDDAIKAAGGHRAQFGDDVIQHYAVEYDGFLACSDCDWTIDCESLDDYYEEDGDELNNRVNEVIDQYLLYLRGRGPEPDLTHLSQAQRRAMQARLGIVAALADRDLALPALGDDPVAMRLGLVDGQR
jgi:hypothetical protein